MLTAGMTAEKAGHSGTPLLPRVYAITTSSAKQLANSTAIQRLVVVLVLDLVEEGIAQRVGVGVPLARALVGGQCRRPELVGAVLSVHREVEAVAEEQLGPFPPGAELPDAAQQVVAVDQRRGHVGGDRAEHQPGADHAV